MNKIVLTFFSFLCLINVSIAQSNQIKSILDPDDDPYEKKNYFMVGFNYLSDNVYLGRKDSVPLPFYSPYIGYHWQSGIFTKATASYASDKGNNHFDLLTLEAGYEHNFTKNINGGVNLNRYFYNKNSHSIRSNAVGDASINGQFTNDYIEPTLTFDFNFNKKSTDYVTEIALDHSFSLKNGTINIIPTFTMFLGTQNYYDEYFVSRLTKADKRTKVKKVVADAQKFTPLDYEINTKITYRVKKWLFTVTPTYALPVSPAIITLPKRTVQEKLTNSFFLEIDICYR